MTKEEAKKTLRRIESNDPDICEIAKILKNICHDIENLDADIRKTKYEIKKNKTSWEEISRKLDEL